MKKIFLIFVTLLLASALFAKGGQEPAASAELPAESPLASGSFNEAPMLAARVASGDLPPVDERLPTNPRVGEVKFDAEWLVPKIGTYGGTLRLVGTNPEKANGGSSAAAWILNEYYLDGPYKFPIGAYMVPNVFEDFYVSTDYMTTTIVMREGLKFSNGEPFTTEDIRFWYEDIMNNPVLMAKLPNFLRAPESIVSSGSPTGTPAKLVLDGDYKFSFVFDIPYPKFISTMRWNCSLWGTNNYFKPDAFYKQFHVDYADPADLAARVEAEGFETGEWNRLFNLVNSRGSSVDGTDYDVPVLSPYVQTKNVPGARQYERNPYYWKIDAEGNQLPYIDYLRVSVVNDTDAAALKIIAGEVDIDDAAMGVSRNQELIAEYADEQNYSIVWDTISLSSPSEVVFNLTNPDPRWQKVARDIRFRYALSLAVNRQKVIDIVYDGKAGMPRTIPHLEYDVAKANDILDSLGLERDRAGWRMLDGERLVIPFEVSDKPTHLPTAEVVAGEWEAIGIKVDVKQYDSNYWIELAESNQLYILTNHFGYPEMPTMARHYLGALNNNNAGTWGLEWYKWWMSRTEPEPDGEYPPPEYFLMWEMEKLERESFDAEVKAAAWENERIWLTSQYYWLSMCDDVPGPIMASNDLGNVPSGGPNFWAVAGGEILYFK